MEAGRHEFSRSAFPKAAVRQDDLRYVVQRVRRSECCSLVGVSNTGKSTLLRSVTHPEVQRACKTAYSDKLLPVFIDCLMPERTTQGFYELLLHRTMDELEDLGLDDGGLSQVRKRHRQVITARATTGMTFFVHEALEVLCEEEKWKVVLIFDELDVVYRELSPAPFRALRAWNDEFEGHLCYITATAYRLDELRLEPDLEEFVELFSHNTRVLSMLTETDCHILAHYLASQLGMEFTESELGFVARQSGGHPGLVDQLCRVLLEEKRASTHASFAILERRLQTSKVALWECERIWKNLSDEERACLAAIAGESSMTQSALNGLKSLEAQGIAKPTQAGPAICGELFWQYVLTAVRDVELLIPERLAEVGVVIDDEANVWVDGQRPREELSRSEFLLLSLLYQRKGAVCSTDQIAAAVWPELVAEGITDQQIQKVMSRLRRKIEPNPRKPRYLVTVRGRGYKLAP